MYWYTLLPTESRKQLTYSLNSKIIQQKLVMYLYIKVIVSRRIQFYIKKKQIVKMPSCYKKKGEGQTPNR